MEVLASACSVLPRSVERNLMRYFQVLCQAKEGYFSSRAVVEQTNILCKEFDEKAAVYMEPAEDMKNDLVYINVISHNNYITCKKVEKTAEEAIALWDIADNVKILKVCEKPFVDIDFSSPITACAR